MFADTQRPRRSVNLLQPYKKFGELDLQQDRSRKIAPIFLLICEPESFDHDNGPLISVVPSFMRRRWTAPRPSPSDGAPQFPARITQGSRMLAHVRNSTPGPTQDLSWPLVQKNCTLPAEFVGNEGAPMISPAVRFRIIATTSDTKQVLAADGGDVNSLLGNLRISLSAVGTATVRQDHVEQIERCPHLSLLCVISGCGQICVDDELIEAAFGTVSLVPRDREVSLRASTKSEADFVVSIAHLSIDAGRGFSFFQTFDRTIVNHSDTTFADLNVLGAFEEVSAGHLGAHAIAEALLTVLLIKNLCAALADTRLDRRMRLTLTHPGVARVLNAITNDPGRGYGVEDLATIAGLTRHELAQMFHEIFSQTPANYLKCVRLKLAESLLLDTRQPVKTIAGIVGYASRSHFSRTFREHRGVDPTEYRQMHSA